VTSPLNRSAREPLRIVPPGGSSDGWPILPSAQSSARSTVADVSLGVPSAGATLPRSELQHVAGANRRRHATRHTARMFSLIAIDAMGVLVAMLLLVLLMPDDGWGHIVRWSAPGAGAVVVFIQSAIAVCSGLVIMRAYQEGDPGLDFGRVLIGSALGLLLLHWSMIWNDASSILFSYAPSVLLFGSIIALMRHLSARSWEALVPSASEAPRALFIGEPREVESMMQRNPLKGAHALVPVAQLDLRHATLRDRALVPDHGAMTRVENVLQNAVHEHDVDTVLLCSHFEDHELAQIVATAESAGCRVLCLSRTHLVSRRSPTVRTYDHTPVVELTQPGIRGRDVVLKRLFDVVTALSLLVLLAPVLIVVAVLVKRSSPGAVLFRQERVGHAGRRFHILKFRSMCDGAEAQVDALRGDSIYQDARLFKVERDPRVTPLGRFLRKSSVDELPQLFNVVHGSMSLVGPRPPLPSEVEAYGDRSFLRFDVKPGITGPWQVNGRNRVASFDQVIALEAAYVDGWTIWRDFAILARTVPVVLRMDGAY